MSTAAGAPPRVHPAVSSLAAIGGALVAGSVLLWLSGLDPLRGYAILLTRGLVTGYGVTETLIKMAPLMMVAAGLLVSFRAGVWNIGVDGQFLVGAILTAALAPWLLTTVPHVPALVLLGLTGAVGGAAWGLFPALLKARYGLNEVITTVMMNYVAVSLTTWLVKGTLRDRSDATIIAPQTTVIPESLRLPLLPFSSVHVGLAVGALALLLVYLLMRNTALGFKLSVLGANRRAAVHAGLPVGGLTVLAMLVSAAFAGLAGANDVMGVLGMFAAEWNPRYGLMGVALVFMARFNGLAVIPLAYFFSFLRFGGELMSRAAGIPIFFVDVLTGVMLILFAAAESLERRRGL